MGDVPVDERSEAGVTLFVSLQDAPRRMLIEEIERLREIEEAARLTRNAIIRDEKGFHGEWVAIPRGDFDRLRTALEADTGGGRVSELDTRLAEFPEHRRIGTKYGTVTHITVRESGIRHRGGWAKYITLCGRHTEPYATFDARLCEECWTAWVRPEAGGEEGEDAG